MSQPSQRRALRAQRRALRKQLAESAKQLRAQVQALPAMQERQKARRRKRQAALTTLMAILLLLLLLRQCDCGPGLTPSALPRDAGVADAGTSPLAAPKVRPQRRGQLRLAESPAPFWLDDYRLQVASRSPRLADCFQGAERPGALRWTAAVNAVSGHVADHELEPVGETQGIDPVRRECLVKALSAPPYHLMAGGDAGSSTPVRVSIVIEF